MPTIGHSWRSPEEWMGLALELAATAAALGEVPVAAVLVCDGALISSGFNLRETLKSATKHAEMLAIERACSRLASWRLSSCELFVTLEPCLMCAGALYQARLKKITYAAFDSKAGAMGSLYRIHEDARLNHRLEVQAGILADASKKMLQDFFQRRRREGSPANV